MNNLNKEMTREDIDEFIETFKNITNTSKHKKIILIGSQKALDEILPFMDMTTTEYTVQVYDGYDDDKIFILPCKDDELIVRYDACDFQKEFYDAFMGLHI